MSEPEELSVEINGFSCRVWRTGQGPKLGFLAGFGGLPRWIPFLDALARERTVIVPSLPGFPGGERGHTVLDSHLDWVLAVRQLLLKAGLDGADLAASSVGGSFVAEVAAIWPAAVRRLALIAPWGLFDEKDPMTDPWAQRAPDVPGLLCADRRERTLARPGPPAPVHGRCGDYPDHGHVIAKQRDQRGPYRHPADEVLGSVDRVDDPLSHRECS